MLRVVRVGTRSIIQSLRFVVKYRVLDISRNHENGTRGIDVTSENDADSELNPQPTFPNHTILEYTITIQKTTQPEVLIMPATLKKVTPSKSVSSLTNNTPTMDAPMIQTPTPIEVSAITHALARPFDLTEVKFKPQTVKNNRALALAYVDARVIQDRLDDVLGVEGWQDEYQLLPDGSVSCRLRLKLGPRWITKMDVGSPSEQPDGGDRLKAAFSDALKRAAVKFGIGRYLYRLPAMWGDYAPIKKIFPTPPRLPAFAQPTYVHPTSPMMPPIPAPPVSAPSVAPVASAPVPSAPVVNSRPIAGAIPENGHELERRLREKDQELNRQGKCVFGALLAHVTQAGIKAGFGADLTAWEGTAILLAVEETKKFCKLLTPTTTGSSTVTNNNGTNARAVA